MMALPLTESTAASELLGEQHPLVRALELYETLIRQSAATLVVLVCGAIGAAANAPWASSILVAGAAVQLALCVGILLLVDMKRWRVRDVIIDGRGSLPLRCVAIERRRLLHRATQCRLAHLLERALDAAENWERLGVACRPPQGVRLLPAFSPELRELADDLRAGDVGVRGVALAARMLAGGYASPLYAGRLEEVQEELTRMRHVVASEASCDEKERSPGTSR